jgi:hypothetical protein
MNDGDSRPLSAVLRPETPSIQSTPVVYLRWLLRYRLDRTTLTAKIRIVGDDPEPGIICHRHCRMSMALLPWQSNRKVHYGQ